MEQDPELLRGPIAQPPREGDDALALGVGAHPAAEEEAADEAAAGGADEGGGHLAAGDLLLVLVGRTVARCR